MWTEKCLGDRDDHALFSPNTRACYGLRSAVGSHGLRQRFEFRDGTVGLPNHHWCDDDDISCIRWIGVDHCGDVEQLRVDGNQQRQLSDGQSGCFRVGRRYRPIHACAEHRTRTHGHIDDHWHRHPHHAARAVGRLRRSRRRPTGSRRGPRRRRLSRAAVGVCPAQRPRRP
jgi:hypothetical protein